MALISLSDVIDTVPRFIGWVGRFLAASEIRKRDEKIRESEQEKSCLQSEISSLTSAIKRRLDDSQQWQHIRRLTVPIETIRTELKESHYFDDDAFYALKPDSSSEWSYELSTEADELAKFLGMESSETEELKLFDTPIHVWRRAEPLAIDGHMFKSISSRITVQKLTHDEVMNLYERGLRFALKNSEIASEQVDGAVEQVVGAQREMFQNDPIGQFMAWRLQNQLKTDPSQIMFTLNSINRIGQRVHDQMTGVLSNVMVNDRHHKRFFIEMEEIVINMPGSCGL